MNALVIRADARALPLPDASVDLLVTSPPYFALRSYTDGGEHYAGQVGSEGTPAEYIAALVECTREWVRVLKPSGSIFVNLGDKYNSAASGQNGTGKTTLDPERGIKMYNGARGAITKGVRPKSLMLLPERYRIACVDDLGLIARAVLVWSKPNGLPESVTDRVRRSHEDWVHLTKQPRYFAAVDEIREPHAPWTLKAYAYEQAGNYNRRKNPNRVDQGNAKDYAVANPLGKLPGSVWEIATEPLQVPERLAVDHFAAFPSEWPRRLILGWSPTGGTIVDPFGGTGTTAHVAAALGRTGISVDLSADYCRLAASPELADRRLRKVLGLDRAEPVPAGQLGLAFGGAS